MLVCETHHGLGGADPCIIASIPRCSRCIHLLQAQKALQTGGPDLCSSSRYPRLDYQSLRPRASNCTAEEATLPEHQPKLENLFKAVALRLAHYPRRDKSNPAATLLDELPKLKDPKVRH